MKVAKYFLPVTAFFLIFFLILSYKSEAEQEVPRMDGILIHLEDLAVVYNTKNNSVTLESSDTVLSGKKEWSAVKAGPGIYHVRNNRWRGFFWLVDTNSGVVSEVVGREFGAEYGGDVEVRSEIVAKANGENGKNGPQEVRIMFKVGMLRYDVNTKKFVVTGGDTVLSYEEDWDRKEVSNMVFQFRRKEWKDIYWEFDFAKGQYQKKTGVFGSRDRVKDRMAIVLGPHSGGVGGPPPPGVPVDKNRPRISVVPDANSNISGFVKKLPKVQAPQFAEVPPQVVITMPSDAPRPVPPASNGAPAGTATKNTSSPAAQVKASTRDVPGVASDQGFAGWKDEIPGSEWMAKEKALYRNVLKQGSYDVMVVPLQVQVYAFDRVNRSLITRRLAAKIERETDLRVADPTLVARALGERSRRFDEAEVYRLADELKVKYLVRMYAGHNLDERLILTVFAQERDRNGKLGPDTMKQKSDWSGVSFSDNAPPAEAFRAIEADVYAKLRLPGGRASVKEALYGKENNIKVPENFQAVSRAQTASPVLKAYYLQFLGALYPADNGDDHIEMENLFERSIIALDAVSPKSPDYPLLKARAYFYLNSRPAALFSLRDPKTP